MFNLYFCRLGSCANVLSLHAQAGDTSRISGFYTREPTTRNGLPYWTNGDKAIWAYVDTVSAGTAEKFWVVGPMVNIGTTRESDPRASITNQDNPCPEANSWDNNVEINAASTGF